MITVITNKKEKAQIARSILEALPEWFGIIDAREEYISEAQTQTMIAKIEDGKPQGSVCLKETSKYTIELAVLGVLKQYHRQGIGRKLFQYAKQIARESGYLFMQVKTIKMGVYSIYDQTNLFYQSLGFKEFEIFPTLWDKSNPCQIYVMNI